MREQKANGTSPPGHKSSSRIYFKSATLQNPCDIQPTRFSGIASCASRALIPHASQRPSPMYSRLPRLYFALFRLRRIRSLHQPSHHQA